MKAGTNTITPHTFAFLRDLALHNDRPWFERACRHATPLMALLTNAVGLRW